MTILFGGPSIYGLSLSGLTKAGPAVLGSLYNAYRAGYTRIILVDGMFGNVPSVWHKEILYVMANGVEVWGVGSIGALRASELCSLGMLGYGKVFRLYRSGRLIDDDEVCVLHCIEHLEYRPITEAMVDVRFTLRELRRRGIICRNMERRICHDIKMIHFGERTMEKIEGVVQDLSGADVATAVRRFKFSQKSKDVLGLVRRLDGRAPTRRKVEWQFPETFHWKRQFEERIADIAKWGRLSVMGGGDSRRGGSRDQDRT